MLKIDKAIYDTDKVICQNISLFDGLHRGILSQNVLAQLRNFVEYIMQKIYLNNNDCDPNNYKSKKSALAFVRGRGDLQFLNKFHKLLQNSVSHYTVNENDSERLMLKYYEYLLKIKCFLKEEYHMGVLDNINEFPLNIDESMDEYYKEIADRIVNPSCSATSNSYNERSYIQSIRPIFIKNQIFYEVTFNEAHDNASKFNRAIAFTSLDLSANYSVKFTMHDDVITVLGKVMPI